MANSSKAVVGNSAKVAVGVHVRKLGNSWWIDIHREHRRYRSNLRVLTEDEARLEALRILAEVKAGRLTYDGFGISVTKAIEEFIDYLKKKDRAERTVENTGRILNSFAGWLKGKQIVQLRAITQTVLDDYLSFRKNQPLPRKSKQTQEKPSKPKPIRLISATTANNELRRIAAFLSWAHLRRKYLSENPAIGFEYLPEILTPKRVLREDEIRKLVAVSNPLLADIILALAQIGCRVMELLHLTVADLDFEGYELLDQQGKPTPNVFVESTKKGRVSRRVPLNSVAMELFTRLKFAAGSSPDALLFKYGEDAEVCRRNVRRDMMAAAKRAKIDPKGCTPHAIRRGFCTRLAAVVPASALQYLAGHADARTTNRWYRGSVAVVPPAV